MALPELATIDELRFRVLIDLHEESILKGDEKYFVPIGSDREYSFTIEDFSNVYNDPKTIITNPRDWVETINDDFEFSHV